MEERLDEMSELDDLSLIEQAIAEAEWLQTSGWKKKEGILNGVAKNVYAFEECYQTQFNGMDIQVFRIDRYYNARKDNDKVREREKRHSVRLVTPDDLYFAEDVVAKLCYDAIENRHPLKLVKG